MFINPKTIPGSNFVFYPQFFGGGTYLGHGIVHRVAPGCAFGFYHNPMLGGEKKMLEIGASEKERRYSTEARACQPLEFLIPLHFDFYQARFWVEVENPLTSTAPAAAVSCMK